MVTSAHNPLPVLVLRTQWLSRTILPTATCWPSSAGWLPTVGWARLGVCIVKRRDTGGRVVCVMIRFRTFRRCRLWSWWPVCSSENGTTGGVLSSGVRLRVRGYVGGLCGVRWRTGKGKASLCSARDAGEGDGDAAYWWAVMRALMQCPNLSSAASAAMANWSVPR